MLHFKACLCGLPLLTSRTSASPHKYWKQWQCTLLPEWHSCFTNGCWERTRPMLFWLASLGVELLPIEPAVVGDQGPVFSACEPGMRHLPYKWGLGGGRSLQTSLPCLSGTQLLHPEAGGKRNTCGLSLLRWSSPRLKVSLKSELSPCLITASPS